MALTKWSQRDVFPALPNLFDTLFGADIFDGGNSSATGTTLPAVNIKDTNDEYLVEVAAPGMNKDDFKIDLDNNMLLISSEKENRHEEKDKEGKFTRREFSYQSFQRSLALPTSVDTEKISATYKDGILSVHIPKKEEAKTKMARKIEIS